MEYVHSISSVSDYGEFLNRFKFRNYNDRLLIFDYDEVEYFFVPKYEILLDDAVIAVRHATTFERDYKSMMNDITSYFLGHVNKICDNNSAIKIKLYKEYNKEKTGQLLTT